MQLHWATESVARSFVLFFFAARVEGEGWYHTNSQAQLPGLTALQDPQCAEVTSVTPKNQCAFVQQYCQESEADSLIPYLRLYYCFVKQKGWLPSALLQVAVLVLLVLLFRVLSSTAEDFFSPILTQLSQELGLPPRFAAVTFLALGNGAPDVSASIAAVHSSSVDLALGALFGGGMFVGCVVAGCVTLASKEVKVRGALLRDVAAYAAAAGLVAVMINSGRMTYGKAALLLIFYVAFVAIVFVADIAHIIASRMRQRRADLQSALLAPESESLLLSTPAEDDFGEHAPLPVSDADKNLSIELSGSHDAAENVVEREGVLVLSTGESARLEGRRDGPPPISEQGSSAGDSPQGPATDMATAHSWHYQPRSERADSLALDRRRSAQLLDRRHSPQPAAGADDSPRSLSYAATVHMRGSQYRQRALAELAHSDTFFRREPLTWVDEIPDASAYEPPSPTNSQAHEPSAPADDLEAGPIDATPQRSESVAAPTAPLPREQDLAAGEGQWAEDFRPAVTSRRQRTREVLVRVASQSADRLAWMTILLNTAGEYLDYMEYPLRLARQATIPMLDAESYKRNWFITALLLAPLAALLYLHQLSPLILLGGLALGALLSFGAAWFTIGTDKDTPPLWDLGTGFPIGAAVVACASLTLAAMWVDVIASELVGLIGYLGILARIDHTVLGLTVLAWGNSLGDLSTDLAMAKRGLSNMAITACFAGPMFNLLVALGAGFIWRCSEQGSVATVLTSSDKVGVAFIILNSAGVIAVGLAYRGRLPGWYGWVQLSMYGGFLVLSLLLL